MHFTYLLYETSYGLNQVTIGFGSVPSMGADRNFPLSPLQLLHHALSRSQGYVGCYAGSKDYGYTEMSDP